MRGILHLGDVEERGVHQGNLTENNFFQKDLILIWKQNL